MLFVFLLSDCKYLLYFWLRECLKVLFIIQSINMLESINNLHTLRVSSSSFLGADDAEPWSTWGASLAPGSPRSSHHGILSSSECWPPGFGSASPFSECTWGQWLEAHPMYVGLCLAVPASPPVPWEHRWDATGGTFWGFWSSAAVVRGSAHRAGSHIPPFSPDPLLPPCQAPNDGRSAKPGAEPYGSTQLALQTVTQAE